MFRSTEKVRIINNITLKNKYMLNLIILVNLKTRIAIFQINNNFFCVFNKFFLILKFQQKVPFCIV